jgi:two-component system OmpR family sensor kinase
MKLRENSFFQKLFFPYSLRYQLLARTLFILAFILLAIGLLQYFVMKDFLYQNEADTLNSKLMSLPRDIGINGDMGPAFSPHQNNDGNQSPHDQNRVFFLQDFSLAYIDENGIFNDLLGNSSLEAPKLSKIEYTAITENFANKKHTNYKVVSNANGKEQLIVFKPLHGDPNQNQFSGILQMGISTTSLHNVLFQQLFIFIILSVLALSGGLVIYLRVLKKTLIPLSKIVEAVKNTNAGNLADRLPVQQGQEEIDRLAKSFNGMLERLEVSFEYERETKEQMRRFIADASHELRTPLTSINGFVEVLLRGAAHRPEQLYKALNSMQGESKRIIKLVEDLLFLTKMDQTPKLQVSRINLSELVKEMEPQLQVIAGSRKVEFDFSEGIVGDYEADKIKQVILNLFNNAVQHTDPQTGRISLKLEQSNQNAELSIQDNGPGIPPEHLPHIFDRFYRADSSRTRQYGGAGLGLAISKSIVDAHRGKISVESEIGKGTIFHVSLPL